MFFRRKEELQPSPKPESIFQQERALRIRIKRVLLKTVLFPEKEKPADQPFLPQLRGRSRFFLQVLACSVPVFAVVGAVVSSELSGSDLMSKLSGEAKIELNFSCKPNSDWLGKHPEIEIRKTGDPGGGRYIIAWGRRSEEYNPRTKRLEQITKFDLETDPPPPGAVITVYRAIDVDGGLRRSVPLTSAPIPKC